MAVFELPNDFLNTIPDQSGEKISILSYSSKIHAIKTRVTLHQHLFSFLQEGQKSVSYAQKSETIDPSKSLLLLSGNCLMSEKTTAENGNYRSILLFFNDAVLADLFLKYPHLRGSRPKENTVREPFLAFAKDPFIQNFLASLDLMLARNPEISSEMKQLKLEELVLYLWEKQPEIIENLHFALTVSPEDMEIRLTVEKHLESAITVEEMAFLCNISLSTFKRRFTKIYGASPSRWMLNKRMETAALMLSRGQQKPSEIYHQVGYENLSSFIQSFKQVYGLTPKEFQTTKLNA